jgi:hypothetical protein
MKQQGTRMADNHIAAPEIAVKMTPQEWGVVTAALYKAPLPLELTGPVVNKLTQQVQAAMQPKEGADTP